MRKEDFKVGESVTFKIYEYDEKDNTEYIRKIKGTVYYKNNFFVTIDNGYYKECFKYCQMQPEKFKDSIGNAYDLSLETYTQDIIKECIKNLHKEGIGYVFNYYQLNEVIKTLKTKKYITEKENDLYYIKLI